MASSISTVKQTLQTILERLLKIKKGLPPEDLNIEERKTLRLALEKHEL